MKGAAVAKPRDDAVNPDEHIVEIKRMRNGVPRVFYAIYDAFLNYWRSVEPISAGRAWTRDLTLRAWFPSREAAGKELQSIWQYRREVACS
jgi:hypothetical protein